MHGGKEGRGLYAGRETETFKGFKKDEHYHYGGQLMSIREMRKDDHDHMMR